MSGKNNDAVRAAVNQQVDHVMSSGPFTEWLTRESPRVGERIVFNNSFLYREKSAIKTVKSSKYLCIDVQADGPALPAYIIEPGPVRLPFKRMFDRDVNKMRTQSLNDAIEAELKGLGIIFRALIGAIGKDQSSSVSIEQLLKGFKSLDYQPDQSSVIEIASDTISINRLDDVDAVWQALAAGAAEAKLDLTGNFAEKFESVFASLRESAHRPVDISKVDARNSILGEVVHHIDLQIDSYSRALEAHLIDTGTTEHLNDILRISYNFADGAQQLTNLIIGLSDMKPVIFWLTIGAQFDLADRFSELPYSIAGSAKPSLGKYRDVIGGARNQTFHNIFSFARPFQVSLTGDAFQAAQLHLFREYSSRSRPALNYADQKLVDLLAGFTRTAESPAPRGFWEKNLEVMRATKTAAESLRDALILLAIDD